jgi:uncharacterized protein (DUF1919 family)
MFSKIKRGLEKEIIKLQQDKFKKKLLKVKNKDFTIISSNCIGSKLYQLMNLPYTTPCVGLYFFAPCFLKFITNLREYLHEDLQKIDESQYLEGNENRKTHKMYPIGRLGDIEIHFMHYSSWNEAVQKWNTRAKRINFERLFFIFTDKDLCDYSILSSFDQLSYPKKVCFTAKKYILRSCVQIPFYDKCDYVGDLSTNYHLFNNTFDFVKWFDES